MKDPQDIAKLDPKSMVGTINSGGHKTLLYTNKYVYYGPHRKDLFHYKSMKAIDHQGHWQFSPKGLGWQGLDVATY